MKCATLYTPVHVGIWKHRKTLQLARALKIRVREAVGLVIEVVHLAASYAPDGNLEGWTVETLEQALGKGPRGKIRALIDAGFIDATENGALSMHEWELYSGKSLSRRFKETARKRALRSHVPRDNNGTSAGQQRDVPPVSGSVPSREGEGDIEREIEKESERDSAAGQATDTEHPLIGGWISEPEDEEQTEPDPRPSVALSTSPPKRRLMGPGVIGTANDAKRPRTLEQLKADPVMQAAIAECRKTFPGFGCEGGITLDGAFTKFVLYWEDEHQAGRRVPVYPHSYAASLVSWVSQDYDRSGTRKAYEAAKRNGTAPPPAVDPQADPRLTPRLNDWENFLGYRNRGGDLAFDPWKLADRPYSRAQLRPPWFSDDEAAKNRQLLGAFTGNLVEQKTIKDDPAPDGDQ